MFVKSEYEALLRPHFEGVPFPEIAGEKPLVSILTPYYNNAQYLEDFFDSIFAQTYSNWEMLFVDDASPDRIAENAVAQYQDSRIRFLRLKQNSGAAIARNVGFQMSRGEYIACFDPDDIMHPWHLQALMATALSELSPDIVMMNLIAFGAVEEYRTPVIKSEYDLTKMQWIPGQSLARRNLWQKTNGQSTAPEIKFGSQDWEFWLHCYEKCGPLKVAHVPLPLFLYRQHAASLCSKSDLREYAIRSRILADHPAIFARYGTGEQFLATGYAKTIISLAVMGRLREAVIVLRDGLKKLPALTLGGLCLQGGIQKARTTLSLLIKKHLVNLWAKVKK